MRTVRVNVRSRVNNAKIRRETRNGREKIIVPSATLPDDVVMNRIKYPADVIAKSYQTLEGTLAPLGHPMVGNKYISAKEPDALAGYYFGAHNENVRRENGRVFLDKVIDVARAGESEQGRKLLEVINEEKPIHTSTGLFLSLKEEKTDDYDAVVEEMVADHDAILINEVGAATPEQGVGLFVNAQGNAEEVDVMDVDLDSEAMDEIAKSVARTIGWQIEEEEREKRFESLTNRIMQILKSAFSKTTANNTATGLNVNHSEDDEMSLSSDEVKQIVEAALVANNTANADAIKQAVAEAVDEKVKPIKEEIDALRANSKAAEEKERAELIDIVVKANLFEEDEAKELSTNHLRKLAEKCKPGNAQGLNPSFAGNSDKEKLSAGSFSENVKEAANA